jgi:hypothetical protein
VSGRHGRRPAMEESRFILVCLVLGWGSFYKMFS